MEIKCPKISKDERPLFQKPQRVPSRRGKEKLTPRHITVKLEIPKRNLRLQRLNKSQLSPRIRLTAHVFFTSNSRCKKTVKWDFQHIKWKQYRIQSFISKQSVKFRDTMTCSPAQKFSEGLPNKDLHWKHSKILIKGREKSRRCCRRYWREQKISYLGKIYYCPLKRKKNPQ